MKRIRFVAISIVAIGVNGPAAIASPARFWFSDSAVNPGAPAAPVLSSVTGATRQLHIWAQPATANPALPYNVATNRFRTLRNVSLNVVTDPLSLGASDANLDFIDGSFTIYNPMLDGTSRFQFIGDSQTPMTDISGPLLSETTEDNVMAGSPDAILGLQAFSIANAGFLGIGHSPNHPTVGCHPGDPFCAITSDGSPAWLVASLAFKTLSPTGTAALNLQIGGNGMTYEADTAQVPAVTFGVNAAGLGPTYDARLISQRNLTMPGDEPDATIQSIAAIAGDFNGDSFVNAADYVVWRDGLGTTFSLADYGLWRAHFGTAGGTGLQIGGAIPEPSALLLLLIGWITTRTARHSAARHR